MTRRPRGARAALLDRLVLGDLPLDGQPWPPPDPTLAQLYARARHRTDRPLVAGAAAALRRALRPGATVLLTTGLVTSAIPAGETDGPPGAAVLARALALGGGARALLLAEPTVLPVLAAALAALAAGERDGGRWRELVDLAAFPADLPSAAAEARRLWHAAPVAVIAVEKLGPNARGVIHTMRGEDVTATQARTDLLFRAARARRILTVAVGDRGNEIGMGGLLLPGRPCACGCGGSIGCRVPADRPVVALNSNWGCYGIAVALALAARRPALLHGPRSESRMLRAIVRAGAVDGVTRRATATVDAAPLARQTALLAALQAFLRAALA